MEKLKELAAKIGIDETVLAQIESGELSVDDAVTSHHTKYEETLKSRFKKEIEDAVMPEAFGKAYGKVEKMIAEEFGLTVEEFNDIPKNERTSKMLSKIKELQSTELASFKNIDAKTKQLSEQLEAANKLIKLKEQEKESAISALKSEYTAKETKQIFNNKLTKKISSVDKPALDPEVMESVVLSRIIKNGYNYEIENGKVWLLKDGVRIANPNRATENLDLESYFDIIAKEKNFTRLSNGGGNPDPIKLDLDDAVTKNMHPAYIKHLKSKGRL